MVRPTREDLQALGKRFPRIHSLVLEELLTPTIRPRVENYDYHLYMVLHFSKFTPGVEKSITSEVDFILLPDTIITVQYDAIPAVEDFWHTCENEELQERYGKTPVHLLYFLLRFLYSTALKELDQIQEQIDYMEERVFSGREKEILEDISYLKRDILDFRRALNPQHLTLESLITQGTQLYGEKVKPFLMDLEGEYLRVRELLETHKETLDALYETNNSLVASKTNETMKVFTVLAFITFIPTAIANIYGMNLERLPFTARENAFWFVLLVMGIVTAVVYITLKWRKLL